MYACGVRLNATGMKKLGLYIIYTKYTYSYCIRISFTFKTSEVCKLHEIPYI